MFFDIYADLCKKAGRKPSAVAEELGINKSNVSNWKNNGYTPRGNALQKIADYFGISTDYLLGTRQNENTPILSEKDERDIVFYDKFVLLCTLKGVSPSKAAVDAGISKSLVTKWKVNSVEVPSPEILKKLSTYFGVPVSRLLSEEEQNAPTLEVEDERNVVRIAGRDGSYKVKKLTDEQYAALAAMIDQLPEAD